MRGLGKSWSENCNYGVEICTFLIGKKVQVINKND